MHFAVADKKILSLYCGFKEKFRKFATNTKFKLLKICIQSLCLLYPGVISNIGDCIHLAVLEKKMFESPPAPPTPHPTPTHTSVLRKTKKKRSHKTWKIWKTEKVWNGTRVKKKKKKDWEIWGTRKFL